jgi:hypothetical protein
VDSRDYQYDSAPLSAANYKGQRDVVEYLLQFAPIWDGVKFGGLDRVRTFLRDNPECINVRDDDGRTPLPLGGAGGAPPIAASGDAHISGRCSSYAAAVPTAARFTALLDFDL